MTESGHQNIAHRLRELAERFERERIRPGSAARILGMLAEIEKLAGEAGGGSRPIDPAPPPQPPDSAPPSTNPGVIRIWSDGSCDPNPGPGGWAAIIERDGRREEFSGASRRSTNNIMEMTAAIEGLRRTPPGSEVILATDSEYLVKGITQWLPGWKKRGWQTADKKPVKNQDLWQQLDALNAERRVQWQWVRGHAGHAENERADQLANAARKGK